MSTLTIYLIRHAAVRDSGLNEGNSQHQAGSGDAIG